MVKNLKKWFYTIGLFGLLSLSGCDKEIPKVQDSNSTANKIEYNINNEWKRYAELLNISNKEWESHYRDLEKICINKKLKHVNFFCSHSKKEFYSNLLGFKLFKNYAEEMEVEIKQDDTILELLSEIKMSKSGYVKITNHLAKFNNPDKINNFIFSIPEKIIPNSDNLTNSITISSGIEECDLKIKPLLENTPSKYFQTEIGPECNKNGFAIFDIKYHSYTSSPIPLNIIPLENHRLHKVKSHKIWYSYLDNWNESDADIFDNDWSKNTYDWEFIHMDSPEITSFGQYPPEFGFESSELSVKQFDIGKDKILISIEAQNKTEFIPSAGYFLLEHVQKYPPFPGETIYYEIFNISNALSSVSRELYIKQNRSTNPCLKRVQIDKPCHERTAPKNPPMVSFEKNKFRYNKK